MRRVVDERHSALGVSDHQLAPAQLDQLDVPAHNSRHAMVSEKFVGKTTAANISQKAKALESKFNDLAKQGWELVDIGQIDVTGVAVFRRPTG